MRVAAQEHSRVASTGVASDASGGYGGVALAACAR
jgi:hypothetical protein